MATVALAPQVKRPAGLTILSALIGIAALWLLAQTLMHHVGGLTGVFSLLAALVMGLLAFGLWKLHNGARVFLFFLFVSDVIGCLLALFLYALRTSHYRLAVALVIQMCISAALVWFLQSAGVKRAFEGKNPWPTTVKMLVLTVFTVLLAFPFYWMVIATFKQNVDLYGMENNPFIFNLPPTLDNLRFLFNQSGSQSGSLLDVFIVLQLAFAGLLIWFLHGEHRTRRIFGLGFLALAAWGSLASFRSPYGWVGVSFLILQLCISVLYFACVWKPFYRVQLALRSLLLLDLLAATVALFWYVLQQNGFVRWLGNTAFVGMIVVAITLLLSVPAAYALARLTGKWGERLGIGIFLTYLVPPTLLFIPLSQVVAKLGLQDKIWSLVLVYPSITVPFSIWLLMAFFKSIPRELEDAAMVDGLTRFGAFVRMVIPISLSGILTVVIFTFTLVTQEYVYALTFISPESQQMVGVGIPIFLVRGDVYFWGSLMAACLIASLPIAFLYNLFLDRFIAGFTVGAVKG